MRFLLQDQFTNCQIKEPERDQDEDEERRRSSLLASDLTGQHTSNLAY